MDFEVQADGGVVVTETISWRFPEGEERHGILRNVKVRAGYQESETQYRYYELTGVSVTSPSGAPTDIAVSDFGAYRQIRVGSPSETVSGTPGLRRLVPARATSSTTSATAPRSSTTTSSTPPTASLSGR